MVTDGKYFQKHTRGGNDLLPKAQTHSSNYLAHDNANNVQTFGNDSIDFLAKFSAVHHVIPRPWQSLLTQILATTTVIHSRTASPYSAY